MTDAELRRNVKDFVAGRLDEFGLTDGSTYRRLRLPDGDRCERVWGDGATRSGPFTAELGAHLVALSMADSMEDIDREFQRFTGRRWSEIENPPKAN